MESLSLLSDCFAATVETQTPTILQFYLQTPVSAKVIEALIVHGTHLVQQAKAAGAALSPEIAAAVTLWEANTERLTSELLAQ